MKILHLDGADQDFGGVLSLLRNLAAASAPLGWRHIVWVNERYTERRQPALEYRRSRHLIGESPGHLRLLLQALRAFGELRRLLADEPFDILHAHSRGALLVALQVAARLGRPVLFTNHNYARHRGLYRWSARRKNLHTILLTPNMAGFYGIPVQPPKVSVIFSGFADGFLAGPLAEPRWHPASREPLRFAGVGTLFRWKNWHLVAEAMGRLDESERTRIEFSLIGPTPAAPEPREYECELRGLIQRHRLEKQFLLRGAARSVAGELHRADWLLHPATNEPCGLAILEALALGLPALVSRSGGPVDFVRDGENGLFFAPDDAGDLAAQLRRILNGTVALPPPAAIRETVRAFSASAVLPQYEQLCRRVMNAGTA